MVRRVIGGILLLSGIACAIGIIKDWVDAQLAIIESDMVTLEQVFLPYMQVKGNQTLYETMVERRFLLPEGKQ